MKKILAILAVLAPLIIGGCIGENDMTIHISTLDQLQAMKDDLSADYILDNDIDASATSGWNGGAGFEPVGDGTNRFTGSFDGQNHTISNLTINRPSTNEIGLFGVTSGSEIKNISLTGTITGQHYVGSLAGRAIRTNANNCSSSASVTGDNHDIGGLFGTFSGKLFDCHVSGNVTAITASGGTSIGGFVGTAAAGAIFSSYAEGNVSVPNSTNFSGTGGFVGSNRAVISKCYATGEVSNNSVLGTGGFVGNNHAIITDNCYATGAVTGNESVGGFCGYNKDKLHKCYSIGLVTGNAKVGGLVGTSETWSAVNDSFWDTETSGQATSDGGTGKTTAEMQTESTFTDAGWDFDGIWDMISYPALRGVTPAAGSAPASFCPLDLSGDGSQENPCVITNATQLQAMEDNLLGWYQLGNDIDLTSIDFEPIPYITYLEGNNHTISNLTVNKPNRDRIGFFRTNYGTIQNVGLEYIAIIGVEEVGGLVGENHGTISNCHTAGTITGSSRVGGLVGEVEVDQKGISNCHSNVSVTGAEAGGLIGICRGGSVFNCYATGDVIAPSNEEIGGLIGVCDDTNVSNCFATGYISAYAEAGGLIGDCSNSIISRCYATGDITIVDEEAGGLIGKNAGGSVSKCYATGNVSGDTELGGFIGDTGSSDIISNCYATGNVTGTAEEVGGFVGRHDATISNSFSTGAVTGGVDTGGFCGENNNTISNSFWDTETSGQATSDGGIGKTTAEMQTKSTFTDVGWDFVTIWGISVGSYPVFADLLCNGEINPTDIVPEYFSAICHEISAASYYRIQVNKSSDFSGRMVWDSGKATLITPVDPGERCENISYNGQTLSNNGITYYWRIKFWNAADEEGDWSE